MDPPKDPSRRKQVDWKSSFVTKSVCLIFLLIFIWILLDLRLNVQSNVQALLCIKKLFSCPGLGSIQYVSHLIQLGWKRRMAHLLFTRVQLTVLNWTDSVLCQPLSLAEPVLSITIGWQDHLKSVFFIFIPPFPRAPSVVLSIKTYLMLIGKVK